MLTEADLIRPRVFLADDHSEFLRAEVAFLQPHFDVIGTASNGAMLVTEVQRLEPDVVVVDITMPVINGIEAVRKLVEAGTSAKFVALTVHVEEEFIKACLQAGIQGYVAKSRMKAHLIPAIHAVLDGLPYVSPLSRNYR